MRISCRRFTISISAAAVLLAACGGSHPPIGAAGAMPQSPWVATLAQRSGSWMLPEAKSIKKLIYASDGADVNVYNYDTATQVGSLTGFDSAYGQCVDKLGDVFLTTSINSVGAVLEYAHGGSRPVKTFNTDGNPIGCSISPAGGDLAVDNGAFGATSDVQIWKHAAGKPTAYANQHDCNEMWPPGYDNKGNLYIETGNYHSVCELRAGGASLLAVEFNHDIGFPGSVMWDGKYLAFTDQDYPGARGYKSAIYRAEVKRGVLTVVGTTLLRYKPCGTQIAQPFIVGEKNTPANTVEGKVVIGGNQACGEYSEYRTPLTYWRYPQKGQPFKFVHPYPEGISGQSVSIAP